MKSKVRGKITYLFPTSTVAQMKFDNGYAISPHTFNGCKYIIINPCWDYSQSMLITGGPSLCLWKLLTISPYRDRCCQDKAPAFIKKQDILSTGPRFNIKMSSCQYRKSHYGDKAVVRSSNPHNEISILVRCHLYIESGPWSLEVSKLRIWALILPHDFICYTGADNRTDKFKTISHGFRDFSRSGSETTYRINE